MSKKPTSIIGIELHDSEIRIVEVSNKTGQPTINKMGRIPMPVGNLSYGLVHHDQPIIEAVKGLIASMNITATHAVVGLPDECVPVRTFAVPPVHNDELNIIVAGEVDDNHLLRNEGGAFGFVKMSNQSQPDETHGWDQGAEVWIDSHVSKNRPDMVTVFAAERDLIKGYQSIIEGAGLSITRMEPAHYASYRALLHSEGKSSKFFGIITGTANTDIAVVSEGQLIAFRRIEIGSQMLFGNSVGTEQYAHLKSLNPNDTDSSAPARSSRFDRTALEAFSTEIHRTIYYFQREYPALSDCEKIIMAIDDVRIDGIWEEIGSRLGMNVELARPFGTAIDRSPGAMASANRFETVGSTAFGLALDGQSLEQAPSIDLFRFERLAAKDDSSKRNLRFSIVASVVAVFLGIGTCMAYRSNIYLMEREIQSFKNTTSMAKSAIDQKVKGRHDQADLYRSLRKNAIPAVEVLDGIAGSIAGGTGLQSVAVGVDQSVVIDGLAVDESSMLATIKGLQDSPLIHDLRINYFHQADQGKGSAISFELKGKTVTADHLKVADLKEN